MRKRDGHFVNFCTLTPFFLNSQIKRRTRVVGLFPSEESLERLVTAVLVEISEAWESGKSYLKPEN
jgi:transposase-like protein